MNFKQLPSLFWNQLFFGNFSLSLVRAWGWYEHRPCDRQSEIHFLFFYKMILLEICISKCLAETLQIGNFNKISISTKYETKNGQFYANHVVAHRTMFELSPCIQVKNETIRILIEPILNWNNFGIAKFYLFPMFIISIVNINVIWN